MTLEDIAVEFQDVISPISLSCEEEEIETEVVEYPVPYEIQAVCYCCEEQLRIAVVTSTSGIRQLQDLLLDSLSLLCAGCSREAFRTRRPDGS